MVVQGFFLRLVKQQIQRGGQLVQVAVVHGSQSIYQLHIAAAGIRNFKCKAGSGCAFQHGQASLMYS